MRRCASAPSHGAPGCGACSLVPPAESRRVFLQRAGLLATALVLRPSTVRAGSPGTIGVVHQLPADPGDIPSEVRFSIPADDAIVVDKDNGVMIARAHNRVYAFSLACPHQNTALRWDAGEHEFRCPKHKSRYRPDGTFIDGRATRAMDRLPIRRDGNALVVDVDTLYQQDERPAQWEAAFVQVV
jgi:Rieske Fe-S protein